MLEIVKQGRSFIVREEGNYLLESKSGNLLKIAQFLIEERQEVVEDHIFSGNSIHFDLPRDKEEKLRELIQQEFRKENNQFYVDFD
ncbi:MAG: hypothetical protein PWQ35_129 [Patescibacteria group bacterium]|nr:hypothetical protein [Patescibacteria group bacterium]